jgi:hypothetical protein
MGILFNATSTPPMNDISVTSGNADGWIYAGPTSVEAIGPRPGTEQSIRRSADGRPSVQLAKAGKRRK